jgi:hypothetical protein
MIDPSEILPEAYRRGITNRDAIGILKDAVARQQITTDQQLDDVLDLARDLLATLHPTQAVVKALAYGSFYGVASRAAAGDQGAVRLLNIVGSRPGLSADDVARLNVEFHRLGLPTAGMTDARRRELLTKSTLGQGVLRSHGINPFSN